MTRFLRLLALVAAATLAACAHLGVGAADSTRPEVRYYVIADT